MSRLTHDDGTMVLWLLATLLLLFCLGGLGVDLWNAFSQRRAVAGAVDAAVIAGASGIDEAHLRNTGVVRLDPVDARRLARASLARHAPLETARVSISRDRTSIHVSAAKRVRLTILPMFIATREMRVTAAAMARPRRSQ